MSSSGINFYLENYASFNYRDYWKMWLSFKDTNSVSISQSGANTGYSGIYNGAYPLTYDYRNISKSGTGAAYIQLSPSTGLWDDQMTLLFLNKKNDPKNGILFNCMETGEYAGENVYKGFLIGYTDTSRPYFMFRGQSGIETYVTDFNLTSNHILYFIRDVNNIIIGKYDYFNKENINNTFTINSSYLFEPLSGFYLGWKSGNYLPRQLWNSGNSQILDEFLWFNWPMYDFDIRMVASGWASDFTPESTGSGIITTTGITGYSTGLIPATGITGWGITGTGFLTNEYGISYTGYLSGQLTGTVYQTGVTELTGLIQTPEYFTVPAGITYNSGYLNSFSQNYITFLRKTDNLDFDSINYQTGIYGSPDYNQEGVFDNVRDQFKVFYNGNAISWVNGVAQISGGKINSGTIYNPIFVLERDYYKTGNYIDSTGFYDDLDMLWYNDISGLLYYQTNYVAEEVSPISIPYPLFTANTSVFLNGQRVYSGLDFDINPGIGSYDIEFFNTFPLVTGDLCVINLSGKRIEETGNFAWKQTSTGFNPNYIMVYMNGIRQFANQDFIVSDMASMLSGSGLFDAARSSIFNNVNTTDPFFTN